MKRIMLTLTLLFWGASLSAQDITNNLAENGSFKVKDASSNSLLIIEQSGNTTLNGQLTLTNGNSGYTIPNTDGSANQVLTTNGSGSVSWAAPVSTVPIKFIICVTGEYPRNTVTKNFVGEVVMFTGPSDRIPPNFMECKGQLLSISDYTVLYVVIGNAYGGATNSGTFNLPNLSNLVPKGE